MKVRLTAVFRSQSTVKIALVAIFLLIFGACSTAGPTPQPIWPEESALPAGAPADLDREAPGTVLRSGSDGYLWAVGIVDDSAEVGSSFMARYSGDWPLNDLPRPPLAAGVVLKVFDDVALVSLTYVFPDTEIDGLEVTWEDPPFEEDLGKGMSTVASVSEDQATLEFELGEESGVQPGDIYALLATASGREAQDLQLARRIESICMVDAVNESTSTCRMWKGSSILSGASSVRQGQSLVFLEHTYGREPRDAVIQISSFGEQGSSAREEVVQAFDAFVSSVPSANTGVEKIDADFDPTRVDFYRIESDLEYSGEAQVVVSGRVIDRDGTPHLVINYTGVGPAAGPGMVAAPPEGGVDLGPLSQVTAESVIPLATVVWAAVQVYRGQTSEALIHLRDALSNRALQGALRWHARDQFAMRFAALNFDREALWLVHQDMHVASRMADERAYPNALGTVVRLYDMLGLQDAALAASTEYFDARQVDRPQAAYLSAAGMQLEMLLNAGQVDQARELFADLVELCEDGCEGDLGLLLLASYWATPEDAEDFRREVLDVIVEVADSRGGGVLASARMYQGLEAMRDDRLEDGMIAFLEAERIYTSENYLTGVARSHHFMMMVQMARENPDEAYQSGVKAVEIHQELRDFRDAANTYSRLSGLYVGFDQRSKPGPYLGAAREVLVAAIASQFALGNYGQASEALLNYATFLLKIGQVPQARNTFQRAVLSAIRATRFDVAAMSHLSLGIVARQQNDADTFRDELRRASVMAEMSGDPEIKDAVKRVLTGPTEDEEPPTQLL